MVFAWGSLDLEFGSLMCWKWWVLQPCCEDIMTLQRESPEYLHAWSGQHGYFLFVVCSFVFLYKSLFFLPTACTLLLLSTLYLFKLKGNWKEKYLILKESIFCKEIQILFCFGVLGEHLQFIWSWAGDGMLRMRVENIQLDMIIFIILKTIM